MKSLSPLLFGFLVLCMSEAVAETRVFISANPPDRSGIDQCLANGEKCGAAAALSFCQARSFSQARTFRRVDPDEVTGSVPKAAAEGCPNGGCNEYVAIICLR